MNSSDNHHVGKQWNLRSHNGIVSVKREHDYSSHVTGLDTTGPFWMAGFCETHRGKVEYLLADGTAIIAPRKYFFFFPPFSTVKWRFANTRQTIRSLISRKKPLPLKSKQVSKHAIIFQADSIASQAKIGQSRIEYCADPSALALRCKRVIDLRYAEPLQIKKIADQLNTSPTVLGRYFRKDFGLSPIQYRNSLRVLDAAIQLLENQPISEVFQDVGFEDLSRFYKTFRSVASVSPGKFRPKKSRKTPR